MRRPAMYIRVLFQRLRGAFERGRRFVTHDAWRIGLPGERVPQGIITKQIRVAILLLRGLSDERLLLRASALTFATMLFIVPFLAFMFYFIATFDLGDRVYGAISQQMKRRVVSYIERHEKQGYPDVAPEYGTVPVEPDATAVAPEERKPVSAESVVNDLLSLLAPVVPANREMQGGHQYVDPLAEVVKLAERSASDPGAIGITWVLFVLSTVFGFMRNVETAFNRIWGVRESRKLRHVIGSYLLITLLVPFAAAAVLGVTTALASPQLQTLGPGAKVALRAVQFLIVVVVFSLLYYFVPNTQVRFRYALTGGVSAALLWAFASWLYVNFKLGLANNTVFFSTFAFFPLLLIWVFLSWTILLLGALVSFAYQNEKTFAMERLADKASFAYREAIGVRAIAEMTQRFREGLPGLSVGEMAERWNVPTRLLNETLECLREAGLVTACATDPVSYQPGRAPDRIRVREVVNAIRQHGQDPSLLRQDKQYQPVYDALDRGEIVFLDGTIASLADRIAPTATQPPTA